MHMLISIMGSLSSAPTVKAPEEVVWADDRCLLGKTMCRLGRKKERPIYSNAKYNLIMEQTFFNS